MSNFSDADSKFEQLISALMRSSAYPHSVATVQRIDTHISVILLTGRYAYKIKKPLRLPFLDFSTLKKRQALCLKELRLNQRTAPSHYLSVEAVTECDGSFCVGGKGEAVEYAVKMLQFPAGARLDEVLARGEMDVATTNAIADEIASFHMSAEVAGEASEWATPASVEADVIGNFDLLEKYTVSGGVDRQRLRRLRAAQHDRVRRLAGVLTRRRGEGYVRNCHGDLHLGNIMLVNGAIVPFDCIEFNDGFRWIDVMSDLAFLLMDLDNAQACDLSNVVLNRYLGVTGDFEGLSTLRLYQGYRALVRAKVGALRSSQHDLSKQEVDGLRNDVDAYLRLAERYADATAAGRRPALVVTCGLSGSGKSWLATQVAQASGAVVVRSDVERRRLYDSDNTTTATRYSANATRETYERVAESARLALAAGFDVIADATFLRRSWRDRFAALALQSGAGFGVLQARAPLEVLRARIVARAESGTDPSEADLAVLEAQVSSSELPDHDEAAWTRVVDTTVAFDAPTLARWMAAL